jgi:hypothetical protein
MDIIEVIIIFAWVSQILKTKIVLHIMDVIMYIYHSSAIIYWVLYYYCYYFYRCLTGTQTDNNLLILVNYGIELISSMFIYFKCLKVGFHWTVPVYVHDYFTRTYVYGCTYTPFLKNTPVSMRLMLIFLKFCYYHTQIRTFGRK